MRLLVWILGLRRWLARVGVWVFDDGVRNRAEVEGGYEVGPEAWEVHGRLVVADGHADTLMYERSGGFLRGSRRGHVDLGRLLRGRVGLQVLTVVTQAPGQSKPPYHSRPDALKILAKGQGWPEATWESPRARAMHQAAKWRRWGEDDRVVLVRSGADVAVADGTVALVLGLEGCHAMEKLRPAIGAEEVRAEVAAFMVEGFRLFSVNHQFDNAFGTSSEGEAVAAGSGEGLTPLGEVLVGELERQGALIDVAHSSPAAVDDILRLTERPLLSSHTGVQAHTPGPRNLADEHVRAIARRGGVICIGYWKEAVGGTSVESIADAMEVTAELLGDGGADPWDHIGIGSDYDGAVNTRFNADGHVLVTAELLRRGHGEDVVGRVMGGNLVRLVETTLGGGEEHERKLGGTADGR